MWPDILTVVLMCFALRHFTICTDRKDANTKGKEERCIWVWGSFCLGAAFVWKQIQEGRSAFLIKYAGITYMIYRPNLAPAEVSVSLGTDFQDQAWI